MAAIIGTERAAPPLAERLAARLPWLLAAYFLAQFARRLTETSALGLDEAEQIVMTQAFAWGYGSQPPLYSWVQGLVFQLFGRSVLALALLKNAVLFLTFLAFLKLSERVLRDRLKAAAATLTLFLVPQIGWESQRALVHTPAVVCAAAATLLCFTSLAMSRRPLGFVLFGLAIAAGILSKYSFVIFIAALLSAAATTACGRRVLLDRRMVLVALPVTLVSTAPTLLWSFRNVDLVLARTWKFGRTAELPLHSAWAAGLGQLGGATLAFSILCLAVYCLCALPYRRRLGVPLDATNTALRRILCLTPAISLGLLAVFVVATGATDFKDRWLQPYLFVLPLVCLIALEPFLDRRRQLILSGVGAAAALAAAAALVTYHQAPGLRERPPHATAPFAAIADMIRELGFAGGTIIGPDNYLVGNLMFRIPESRGITPEYSRIPGRHVAPILLAWRGALDVRERAGLDRAVAAMCAKRLPARLHPVSLRAPYERAEGKVFDINVVLLPACPI